MIRSLTSVGMGLFLGANLFNLFVLEDTEELV